MGDWKKIRPERYGITIVYLRLPKHVLYGRSWEHEKEGVRSAFSEGGCGQKKKGYSKWSSCLLLLLLLFRRLLVHHLCKWPHSVWDERALQVSFPFWFFLFFPPPPRSVISTCGESNSRGEKITELIWIALMF